MTDSLRAGAARVCINPTPEMYPIPSSFADWGQAPLLQRAVFDDIYCRALILEAGETSVLLMSFELANYPAAPGLLEELSRETGIPENLIFLTATHNHSSPKDYHTAQKNNSPEEIAFHEKYWVIEREASIQAVREAKATLRPVRYGYGEGKSYVNVNRDVHSPFGFWLEGKNLEGYSDKTLRAIKLVDEEDNLIAAVLNYGMHNTCVHMMKDFDGLSKTSGNVSGVACRFVEEKYPGAVALWTSGAAGNQNPLLSHGMQFEYPDGFSTAIPFPDGVGYQLMEYMGRWHGVDCVRTLECIPVSHKAMPISVAKKTVLLPGQKRAEEQTGHAMFRMGSNGHRKDWNVPTLPETPIMVDGDPVPLELQLLLLGDIALLLAGGELYAELGRDILNELPYKNAMVVTHTALEQAGYILDKTSKDKKVFQAFMPVKPGCSDELIVDNVRALCDKILG